MVISTPGNWLSKGKRRREGIKVRGSIKKRGPEKKRKKGIIYIMAENHITASE